MKKIYYICFLLLFSLPLSLFAEQNDYSITSHGINLGHLTAIKTTNGDTITLKVKSKVKIHLLMNFEVKYRLHNTYFNDTLLTSSVLTYVDGEIHSNVQIEKMTKGYQVIKDGVTLYVTDIIDYTAGQLYFKEPLLVSNLFSEIDGAAKKIEKTKDNTYTVVNSKRNSNTYVYNGGELERAEIKHSLITFYITKLD
ncbi:MAG: hypothetical protein ACI9JN_002683 [Bacteroidia bacterium]|jgi:hypothetical protein